MHKKSALSLMHSSKARPRAPYGCMTRKCAQLSASPHTCCPYYKTWSVLLEQRVALILHCHVASGGRGTSAAVAPQPLTPERVNQSPSPEQVNYSKKRQARGTPAAGLQSKTSPGRASRQMHGPSHLRIDRRLNRPEPPRNALLLQAGKRYLPAERGALGKVDHLICSPLQIILSSVILLGAISERTKP